MPNNSQTSNNIKVNQNQYLDVDEIDLSLFFKFFIRNKRIIASSSLATFLVSIFLTFFVNKIWTGQFEIVLNNQNINTLPEISMIPGITNNFGPKDIKTEVGILESPSVLMPVFDFLNKTKITNNQSSDYKEFNDWKKHNLKINLKKNTSILQISYFDTEKDLIVPVLEKISNKYQDYSNRSKKRSNELTKLFLENQVKIYRQKSELSFKAAQSFAIDQNLDNFDFYFNDSSNKALNLENKESDRPLQDNQIIIPNIGIEQIRVSAANRIRDVDFQIKKIQQLGNDTEIVQYVGTLVPDTLMEELTGNLENLDKDLIESRSKYRDNDKEIKLLLGKRDLLIKLIKRKTIGYLKVKKLSNEALMESAMRPKEVLLNYKDLLREAKRDEMTLIDLENRLRIVEIDESRLQDPWELITSPTLIRNAVYPSKKQFGIFGLVFGVIIGSLISYYKEKKSDLIIERKILERILSIPITEEIYINQISRDSNIMQYIKRFINFDDGQIISIMPLGLIQKNTLRLFQDYVINNKEKNKKSNLISYSNNLSEFLKSSNKFLLANMKNIKYSDIKDLKNYLKITDLKIMGIILINEEIS